MSLNPRITRHRDRPRSLMKVVRIVSSSSPTIVHCVSLEGSIGMYLSTQCGDYVATYLIIDSFELLTPPPKALLSLTFRYNDQETSQSRATHNWKRKKKRLRRIVRHATSWSIARKTRAMKIRTKHSPSIIMYRGIIYYMIHTCYGSVRGWWSAWPSLEYSYVVKRME